MKVFGQVLFKLTMEVTNTQANTSAMKPATLLLWIVVAVGTSVLANIDFGQHGASKSSPQQNPILTGAASQHEQLRDIPPPEPVQKQQSISQPQPQARKTKSQSQTPFDSPFQVATNYYGQEGIGLRWSQHFFDNPLDLGFKDGLQHLEESKVRRLRNIQEQVNAMYKLEEGEAFPEFRANFSTPIYLSHVYYQNKWDTVDQDTYSLASAQNGYVSGEQGTCSPPAEVVSDDMDLSKKRILSNRVKMGLAVKGTKEEQKNLRQSAIMSLAFGWLPSCELPVDRIERNENEQIIEETFSKMAKTHHIQNYGKFVDIFSSQEMTGSRNVFSRSFYTVDHGTNHPAAKLGGIVEGVHAKDISNLTKSKSPRAATFFGQRVDIQPNFINFNQIQILRPEQMKFTIGNLDSQDDIIINDVFTSTPELLIYPPKGVQFPATLKAGENMTFTCLIVAETWGMIQGSVTVAFDAEFMFMLPVTAFSITNEYEIEPVYYSNVNVGEQVNGLLKLRNPSTTEELEIIELYSTEDYLKLFWPNHVPVASTLEAQSNRDFSKYLKIEPGAKSKTILNYRFETDQAIDHRVVIHMLTSRGDILRIPFYFHVYTDLVKFTPSIVDFGLVPFRFDLLKIPVSVSIRNGVDFNVLYLSEVLLPMQDKRLDFVIGAWDRENYGNIQVINKNTRRLEEQRRGVLQRDRQLHLFTIILNPIAFGPVETNVVLVFNTDDGTEFRVDLPIIGHVLPTSNLLTETDKKSGGHFQPWTISKPAIRIDVSHQLNDPTLNSPQLLKSKRVEERLILANTLGTHLTNFEVINTFPDSIFTYFSGSSSRQGVSSRTGVIAPGQTIQLGAFILNIKDLKTTSGRYYSFVHVNGNLFLPIAIQINDNRLLCSYQPDEYQVPLYKDCQSGLNLDFGNLVPYQPKHKFINMTNLGSEPVQIDWLTRTILEIQIRFLQYSPPLTPGYTTLGSIGEWTSEELRQRLSVWIQPQQTLMMQVTVEPTQRTMMGGSEIMSKQQLSFQFIPRAYSEFNVSVSFRAYDGTIQFLPRRRDMTFGPAFIGQEKHEQQTLSFKSNLKKDVLIKSITVDDPRFKVTIINSKLSNQSEVLRVVFDPNQKPVAPSVAVSVKNTTDLPKILQRITNQDTQATTKTTETTAVTEFLPISVKDITKLRYTQETLFKNRKESESKLVEATLTVETDFVNPLNFKLSGVIVPPEIINTTKIDFGKVAVGTSVSAPLQIQNPFNDTMKVQLFVGRTTLQIENELRRLKLLSITEDPVLNQNFETDQSKEKFAEKLLRELKYSDFYCFKMLSITADNKLLAESTPQYSRQWQLNHEWLDEYEDAIFLDRESPKDLVCAGILKVMAKYNSREEFQLDIAMWQRIDKFFRELLIANINLQTNLHTDSVSYEYLNSVGVISQIESLIDQLVKGNDQIAQLDQHPKSVDQEILDDLIHCSAQQPLLEVNQTEFKHITQQIAFPNVLDFYIPVRPFIRSCLWMAASPLRWTYSLFKSAYQQEGLFNQTYAILSETFSGAFDLFQNSVNSRKKSKSLRPEDFLVQRARDKNFQPAATITNQFQFINELLHEHVLKNNGTIGIERNVQNFYLNSKYLKSFTIPPLQSIYLTDVVIFEPRALTTSDLDPLQMNLYIKTDKIGLQKIELVGQASSSLLELTDIVKLIQDQKGGNKYLHQKSADLPMFCGSKEQGQQQNCINSTAHSSFLIQQLVGRSTLTPLISLKVDLRDVLMSATDLESNQSHQYLQSSFTRLLRLFSGSDLAQLPDSTPKLAEKFDWLLTFANLGNANFQSLEIGFEDQVTGEISCNSGELFIEPCTELHVPPQKSKTVHLRLQADYSTAVYKKTLVFKSVGHIQRFPLHLNTDSQILDFALQLKDATDSNQIQSLVLVIVSLAAVGFYLRTSVQYRHQKLVSNAPKPADPVVQVETNVVDHPVQDHTKVQTTQDNTKEKEKKIPTVLTDYQKVTNKKVPIQIVKTSAKQTSLPVEEESKDLNQKPELPWIQKVEVPLVQAKVIQASSIESSSKVKKPVDETQIQVQAIDAVNENKSQPEKPHQSATVNRMSKREKRALEQKKREAEIMAAIQTESESLPSIVVEPESKESLTEDQRIVFSQNEQSQEREKKDESLTQIQTPEQTVEVIVQETVNEFVKVKSEDVELKQGAQEEQNEAEQIVKVTEDDKPAPAVREKVIAQSRVDSPRPQREQIKKPVADQLDFQVPQRLKKPDEQEQPKYKRVTQFTKVTEESQATTETTAKPKTATSQTAYQAPKPVRVYQRTVSSIERPLSAFAERRSAQPQPPVQQKQPVTVAQVAKPTTSTRTVVDKSAENYLDRSQPSRQFSSANSTHPFKTNQSVPERQETPPYYQARHRPTATAQPPVKPAFQERRRNDEYWYDNEDQEFEGSHQQQNQRQNQIGHAYHRNKRQNEYLQDQYGQEQEEYDEDNDEYSQENDNSQQDQQYNHYQKRSQWQQNQDPVPQRKKSPSASYTPTYQKTYAQKPTFERSSLVSKSTYQPVQAVYQPKKMETQGKTATEQSVINETPMLNQDFRFADLKIQETPNHQPQLEIKQQEETISAKKPEEGQDSVKADNFYNAFKSIQSIFSQKKVIQEEEEKVPYGYQELSSKKPVTSMSSQGFSIFSNSVFARDTKASLQSQSAFEFQPHINQSQRKIAEPVAQQRRELFKQAEDHSQESLLAFKPLQQYNSAFSDTLNRLTSAKKQQEPSNQATDQKEKEESRYKFF